MGKRYFPIRTDTSCRLKWSWSTIYLTEGTTASCHRASSSLLNKNNFSNFHNLPVKLEARKAMLNGQWPGGGCEYCKNIEEAGGYSDRNFQNTVPDVYPAELNQDPTQVVIDPVVLEIFFNNTCNLSCIYCSEIYSSSIERENLKFGGPILTEDRDILKENKYEELSPLLWEWLEEHSHKLHRIHILGGEPLIQQDFTRLVEFFEQHPNPTLEFNVVTNLIIKKQNLINQVEKLQTLVDSEKIKRVDILCSVDSWGTEQEYVRSGFNCEQFEENFRYLAKFKWVRLGLLSTVNSLSIPSMPMLAKKFQEWGEINEIFWYMHFILPAERHVLTPLAFDYRVWESYLDQVKQSLVGNTFDINNTKQTLDGIISKLKNSTNDSIMQQRLINYLDKLDMRRNTNWRETFPWLTGVLDNVV